MFYRLWMYAPMTWTEFSVYTVIVLVLALSGFLAYLKGTDQL